MTKRTSVSHPIQVVHVSPGPGYGRIGITFCPGKKGQSNFGGAWDRDLDMDLDAIQREGAATVLTLVEEHEFRLLQVEGLGAGVLARHMNWVHLPIEDVSVPDHGFEAAWVEAGEGLRAQLRDGSDIVVHCRGGLGRAGTIAARLLVELGVAAPEEAMDRVRSVRPGAIETRAQEHHVRKARPMGEGTPERHEDKARDRAMGALVGLAVGDALGTTLEFRSRDDHAPRHTDITGGGPFRLQPGQWTDDTAMALALAESLVACDGLEPLDLMTRFVNWYEEGAYSCTGTCFDIGNTTRAALSAFRRSCDPLSGPTSPDQAGNGSLMRLAPVAIRFWNDDAKRRAAAALQSRVTHGAPEAIDACIVYADMIAEAIAGAPRSVVMRPRSESYAGSIGEIAAGRWRGKPRRAIRSSGYVAHSLEAALWCVGRSSSFADAVILAANLRDDADTTAAITGQLAGALYGYSGIPAQWREKVAWGERLASKAAALFERGSGG